MMHERSNEKAGSKPAFFVGTYICALCWTPVTRG